MGFKIFVNDGEDAVWETDADDSVAVDSVAVRTAAGEATTVGFGGTDDWIRIVINERPNNGTYLDMVEAEKLAERQERYEVKQDTSADGYVAADPETGEPVTSDSEETAPMAPENAPANAREGETVSPSAEASLAEF